MNADSDFQIGKDHLVCQDYALTGTRGNAKYAILCDGCSASPDVDIGARLLAMAAKEVIITHNFKMLGWQLFGENTIQKAQEVFNCFPAMHPQSMDATLLVAEVLDGQVTAYIYGDGVFFHKSASGLYAMRVELDSGAPDYLSYTMDACRKNKYDKLEGEKQLEIKDGDGQGHMTYKPFAPVVIERPVKEGDIIALCSDGIGSFRKSDNTQVPWLDLAEEFIGYKSVEGVFAKRRIAALKRKCAKEGTTHSDDISVAAIVV